MNNKAPMVKLGDLIEECDKRNIDREFGINDVIGMTITKKIIPTKANVKDADLSSFLIVEPNQFVYNPRTHGKKIGLGLNDTNRTLLISWNNSVFRIKDLSKVFPKYLYLIFSREEWDRNACFRSWGSSTEVFSWSEFSLMEIPLPSIEVQRSLVAIYDGLQKTISENETLIHQLESVCHDFVIDCKYKYQKVRLGDWIEEYDKRNTTNKNKNVRSVSVTKEFKETNAKVNKDELSGYKLVPPNHIAYVQTTKNEKCFANALNVSNETLVVSSVDRVITSKDPNVLDVAFIHLFFRSKEFDRYAIFNSWGSAREVFSYEDLCDVRIPLPPKDIQTAIVALFHCFLNSKQIIQDAKNLMKTICPALVQKAAHSA